MPKINVLDLFVGMGAMKVAAKNISNLNIDFIFKPENSYEIKSAAIKQLQYIFNEDYQKKDINEFEFNKNNKFDLLLAGFPCQPFSKAGLQRGFEDNRGNFIFKIIEILNFYKPRFFLLENVDNLINHNNKESFNLILDELKKLNYNVDYAVLNAKDFRLPQNRKRLFIIGDNKKDIKIPSHINYHHKFNTILENNCTDKKLYNLEFTKKVYNYFNDLHYLEGKYLNDKRGGDNNIHSWDIDLFCKTTPLEKNILNYILKERRKKQYSQELGIEHKDGNPLTIQQIQRGFLNINNLQEIIDGLVIKKYLNKREIKNGLYGYSILTGRLSFPFSYFINSNSFCNTLTATEAHKFCVVDNNKLRKLSKRELLKLFGFPYDYSFSPLLKENEIFDLIGNTIAIPVLEFLINIIKENIKDNI